jgi:hypothetical protein
VKQQVFNETLLVTADLFRGDNSFHPSEWFLSVTPAFKLVDNSAFGTFNDFALQAGFLDIQHAIVSEFYDETRLRFGRQGFVSDFRGFVFNDVNDAVRVFGNSEANRTQWNVIVFRTVEKDAASNFNEFDSRDQTILVANVVRRDFIFPGFNAELAFHYDSDQVANRVDAYWLEAAADGNIGRWDVSFAFVQALGEDDANPIAGRDVSVNAQLLAAELAYPVDWFVPKASILYASGDDNPTDGTGRGFDAIFDNPFFAGDGFSYLNREAIAPGGVFLINTFSFLPNMRAKAAAPANFVNPGILLVNIGADAVLTTKTTIQANLNYYQLVHPEPVELVSGVAGVGRDLGFEFNSGLIFKPLIIDNVVFTVGGSVLKPGNAISDLSGDDSLLSTVFTALTLVY